MQARNDSGGKGALAKLLGKFAKSEEFVGVAHSAEQLKMKAREQRSSRHAEHEVHSAEVKACLPARMVPIVLPLSHKRL